MFRTLVTSALFLAASQVEASQTEPAGARSTPSAFQPESLSYCSGWKGPHFVQVGQDGRVALLRAETFEVYPVEREGLGSPVPLEQSPPGGDHPASFRFGDMGASSVSTAAMSAAGDWLIVDGFAARLFRGGKEAPVAWPSWGIQSAGWIGDDPVIGGTPMSVFEAIGLKKDVPATAPVLTRWDGDRWEPLLSGAVQEDPFRVAEGRNLRLARSSNGQLWVAFGDQHRFRRYSAGGRLLTEVVIGVGEIRPAADAERRRKRVDQESAALSKAFGRPVTDFMSLSAPVYQAVTEAADGRVYFLVEGGDGAEGAGMMLERFDPTGLMLEGLPLRIPSPGMATMAAGDDGLYIAAFQAQQGLWRLPWEGLETADWQPVAGAVVHALDWSKLEGAWKEANGPGLLRFAAARAVTFEEGRLAVRGVVSVEANELLLRRSGFGETWKVGLRRDVLRVERDGKAREYKRLAQIPPEVSLTPAKLGEARPLPPEKMQPIAAETSRWFDKFSAARANRDEQEARTVLAEALRFLRETTAKAGWIDAPRFGLATAKQAVVLTRHGDDLLLQLAALPIVERDFKASPDGAALFADYYDALQVMLGGKQRYGTQIGLDPGGEPVVLPLDRRAEVDAARGKLGLPPLAAYLQQASRESYKGRPIRIADGEVVAAGPPRREPSESLPTSTGLSRSSDPRARPQAHRLPR